MIGAGDVADVSDVEIQRPARRRGGMNRPCRWHASANEVVGNLYCICVMQLWTDYNSGATGVFSGNGLMPSAVS